jgi:alpha-glucosidase (family GH31 glycosyl hydrolase)
MAKMSHDACVDANPDRRPFVLTRSGNVGTFRYASSTWSGDNVSSSRAVRFISKLIVNDYSTPIGRRYKEASLWDSTLVYL